MNKRIYEDYLKKSRLSEYKQILIYAKNNGYQLIGIRDFYKLVNEQVKFNTDTRYLISRHDVDTSPKVARDIFNIEKEVFDDRGSATFYFRLSTLDIELMKSIEKSGFESGYHYEELSSYEKRKKYRDIKKLLDDLEIIQSEFDVNIKDIRERTHIPINTVAAHGDFVNRKLSLSNAVILENAIDLREKSNILVEAYDEVINKYVTCRLADQDFHENFCSELRNAVDRNEEIIMILTHPRQWKVDIKVNTIDNIKRACEGIRYRIK